MAEPSPDYKKLFLEEKRRREKAEELTRETTLPEFLHGCHVHLYSGLTVQTDLSMSTRGSAANANHKLRPDRLEYWADFPERQSLIWDSLMDSEFVSERYFTSMHALQQTSKVIQQRLMSSELDLQIFQRSVIEDHVSLIVGRLFTQPGLRRVFGLQGSIAFENHSNMLSPDLDLANDLEGLTVSAPRRRRSPRLQTRAKDEAPRSNLSKATATARTSRPRADQFCVYHTSTDGVESRIPTSVVEYKAPHKLPLSYIYEGLGDMDLEEVIRCVDDTPRNRFRRLIAAVITQAFSYMVDLRVEYGRVSTGEADIYLRVPDDPRTVQYYLSVPKGDVGETTGWEPESDGANRLHLTAIGQMLAFTLQTIRSPPRSQQWRSQAVEQLSSWEVTYEEVLESIPEKDGKTSEYRPPRRDEFLRMSPVRLRKRIAPTTSPGCSLPQQRRESSDGESDPDTPSRQRQRHIPAHLMSNTASSTRVVASRPSRQPDQGTQNRSYCTQKCLLGLVYGGSLDTKCPNVREHGRNRHRIHLQAFQTLLHQQLAENLDVDCHETGSYGACGALFKVSLGSHGYTVAAKAVPIESVSRLRKEAAFYSRLREIQGAIIPVHLGIMDLDVPYYFKGIALVQMMLLSFGGKPIRRQRTAENASAIRRQIADSEQAMRDNGVIHGDLADRNVLWNEETGRVMVIDFDRAKIVEPRKVLGVISTNRKRKSVAESGDGELLMKLE